MMSNSGLGSPSLRHTPLSWITVAADFPHTRPLPRHTNTLPHTYFNFGVCCARRLIPAQRAGEAFRKVQAPASRQGSRLWHVSTATCFGAARNRRISDTRRLQHEPRCKSEHRASGSPIRGKRRDSRGRLSCQCEGESEPTRCKRLGRPGSCPRERGGPAPLPPTLPPPAPAHWSGGHSASAGPATHSTHARVGATPQGEQRAAAVQGRGRNAIVLALR
jgi:hypothetical protein